MKAAKLFNTVFTPASLRTLIVSLRDGEVTLEPKTTSDPDDKTADAAAAVGAAVTSLALPDPVNRQSSRPVEHHQTVSMGVAELRPEMASEQDLLEAADRALYQSKRNGRNRVTL